MNSLGVWLAAARMSHPHQFRSVRCRQIYQQAAARSVCVGTYSHLAVLVQYAELASRSKAIELLKQLFISVESMNPSKAAVPYWQALNRTMLSFDKKISALWRREKIASTESVCISREESLQFLASERERIMKMSKKQAILEVLKSSKIDGKIKAVQSVSDNGLFGMV